MRMLPITIILVLGVASSSAFAQSCRDSSLHTVNENFEFSFWKRVHTASLLTPWAI